MATAVVVALPLMALNSPAATLATAGGKGANLACLMRAGFPVPEGFLLPTAAYRAFVEANQLAPVIHAALHDLKVDDPAALEAASQRIRTAFAAGGLAPVRKAPLRQRFGWKRPCARPPAGL